MDPTAFMLETHNSGSALHWCCLAGLQSVVKSLNFFLSWKSQVIVSTAALRGSLWTSLKPLQTMATVQMLRPPSDRGASRQVHTVCNGQAVQQVSWNQTRRGWKDLSQFRQCTNDCIVSYQHEHHTQLFRQSRGNCPDVRKKNLVV